MFIARPGRSIFANCMPHGVCGGASLHLIQSKAKDFLSCRVGRANLALFVLVNNSLYHGIKQILVFHLPNHQMMGFAFNQLFQV